MMFRKMRRFKQQISEEEWALNIKSVIDVDVAPLLCGFLFSFFNCRPINIRENV